MKEVLAVLVNYGNEQLHYLDTVVEGLKSFKKYNVTVIVHSNIFIDNPLIDEVKIISLSDYQLLPLSCRRTIWDFKNDYDLFIYGENDHLFQEHHLDLHIEYTKILPKNRIAGLIQYEYNDSGKYFPAYHLEFDWDYNSVEVYDNKVFAHFNNVHQATFILTKDQLDRVGNKFDFKKLVDESSSIITKGLEKLKRKMAIPVERKNKYSVKCKVNTDVYLYGGIKKMICISEFDKNLIHHLPNIYINGDLGRTKLRSDEDRMNSALAKLLKKIN